ncbi:MAG: PIG-L family deacetylase [Hyphomicrobiales bacterium]|nr:PIG-L family deacetylase [Hyphomicrobiales bacterium]
MSVAIIAAHPDDEILGVGATAARHVDGGDDVHVLILATGALSRTTGTAAAVSDLERAARQAAEVLGTRPPRFLGLPDNRLDSLDLLDVVQAVEAFVADVAPRIVYTHHHGDLNVDHGITQRAVLTACRPLPGGTVRAIHAFETLSSTEWAAGDPGDAFRPNRYVEVTATLDRKMRALEAYASEMRDFPHPRSAQAVRALAALRGAQVGVEAAEAFMVTREVDRL